MRWQDAVLLASFALRLRRYRLRCRPAADLTLSPTGLVVPPKSAHVFVASGGTEPYLFGFVSIPSGGTVTPGGRYVRVRSASAHSIPRDGRGRRERGHGIHVRPDRDDRRRPGGGVRPHGRIAFSAAGGTRVGVAPGQPCGIDPAGAPTSRRQQAPRTPSRSPIRSEARRPPTSMSARAYP